MRAGEIILCFILSDGKIIHLHFLAKNSTSEIYLVCTGRIYKPFFLEINK